MTPTGNGMVSLAGGVLRRVRSFVDPSAGQGAGGGESASGRLAVTVLCDPTAIDPARLPAPLAEFGDRIEVQVRPAPADKGTELSARLRGRRSPGPPGDRLAGDDPQAELRSALRRAKQLIEVGEVLAVDPAPHGERNATPGGSLLETWTSNADKGGVR